jgi:hypothetical protein
LHYYLAALHPSLSLFWQRFCEARIRASIEHEYQKQFALFQRELDQKLKVELVADLLAEYMRTPQGDTMTREQRTQLNKLSFQASLWLPAELAMELSRRLQNQPEAKSPFELVLVARRLLIDDTSLGPEHVTFWNPTLEKKGEPVLYHDTR